LEKVALGGNDLPPRAAAGYVPTMIFYGVNTPEATWMRMAGLPREVARGAADIWREEQREDPKSFDDIRGWVSLETLRLEFPPLSEIRAAALGQ